MMCMKALVTFFFFSLLLNGDQKFVASVDSETKDAIVSSSSSAKNGADGELAFDLRFSDLLPFEDQLAGHVYIMKDKSGNLLKPYPTENEIAFYEHLTKSQDPVLRKMKEFVPKYYGVKRVLVSEEDKQVIVSYLHIENIMKDYKKACSMDVKLGLIRVPPGAPPATPEQEGRYLKTMLEWGFGISGYSFYRMNGEQVRQGEEEGYEMTPNQAVEAIFHFGQGKLGPKICNNLVIDIIRQLEQIYELYAEQDEFQLYDSSVLITYDAKVFVDYSEKFEDSSDAIAQHDCERMNVPVRVRMFDFGKAINVKHLPVEQRGDPQNYLRGIQSFITLLQYMDFYLPSSVAVPDE